MLHSMDTRQWTDLVSQYAYGKFDILDNAMQIGCNRKTEQVKFDPFYHYDSRPTRGSCSELMSTAYLDIRARYPNVHVTRVTGTEPDFFKDPAFKHCFLFVSDGDLMNGQYDTREPKDIEDVVSLNPLVVDPSFQRVVPLSDSGYNVQRLMNQGCRVSYSNTGVLNQNQGVPLGIDSYGKIVYLIVNFNSPQIMDIGTQEPGSNIGQYRLNSTDLDQLFKDDPKILRFIELLRRREISESKQSFEVENDIIIE